MDSWRGVKIRKTKWTEQGEIDRPEEQTKHAYTQTITTLSK